jgi:hypothetical protein
LVPFSSGSLPLLVTKWNSALISTIGCGYQMCQESYLILAKNFLDVASRYKEMHFLVHPNLWTALLSNSFQDDALLLKSTYTYHRQPFLMEVVSESDEAISNLNPSTNIFESEIQVCQSNISNNCPKTIERDLIRCQEIIQIIMTPGFLRVAFDIFVQGSHNDVESQMNLLIAYSKLLAFSPPGSVFGESRSITETVIKSFAFESSSCIV